jgi:cytoskeletal protein CcmA (bactofilin family)
MGFFTPQQPRKDDVGLKAETKADPQPESAAPAATGLPRQREDGTMPATHPRPKGAESLVAPGITIEGKIEGTGDVRIAGRFKGTVNVKGEFRVESGASIEGEVSAESVLVSGEVRGKIVAASRVELKESASLVGDLKAGSLTVAAGSKMRGNVDCGWQEGEGPAPKDRGTSPLR